MTFRTLEEAVFDATSLADPVEFVIQSKKPDELFSDRHGGQIALLHYMIMTGSTTGVELLLDLGADPNLRSSRGDTPLHVAIIKNAVEIVRLLVDKGANVNAVGSDGDTLLHAALVDRRMEIAECLLEHGADPDTANDRGISPRQVFQYHQLRALLTDEQYERLRSLIT